MSGMKETSPEEKMTDGRETEPLEPLRKKGPTEPKTLREPVRGPPSVD
jgi:hypothetical protein